MAKVWLAEEIYLSTKNETGCMSQWTELLTEAKINIWAACGWVEGDKANFAFITENNSKALELLGNAGYTSNEHSVVVAELEDKPGALWNLTKTLANNGIDGKYMYVSTCGGCPSTRVVIGTTDNEKAVKTLA